MSFSISALTSNVTPDVPSTTLPPVPKPTTSEEILTLASTGEPVSEIATNIGLPIAQVNSDLGETSSAITPVSQANALLALSARLSVDV